MTLEAYRSNEREKLGEYNDTRMKFDPRVNSIANRVTKNLRNNFINNQRSHGNYK